MAQVPHFRMPFRWESAEGRVRSAEVEQDSPEEIVCCVEAIARTPYGHRDEREDFGLNPLLFQQNIDGNALSRAINRQEPRADAYVESDIDLTDIALRRIDISVNERRNGNG